MGVSNIAPLSVEVTVSETSGALSETSGALSEASGALSETSGALSEATRSRVLGYVIRCCLHALIIGTILYIFASGDYYGFT